MGLRLKCFATPHRSEAENRLRGDYATERDDIFADMTLDQIITEIRLRRSGDNRAGSRTPTPGTS